MENLKEKLKSQDNESTSAPFWAIIDPQQNMNKDIHTAAGQFTGVFFSREDAEKFLKATRYNFSKNAKVYCLSGNYSKDWESLFK